MIISLYEERAILDFEEENMRFTSQPQVGVSVSKLHSGRGLGDGVVFGGGKVVPPGFACMGN